LVSLTPYYTHQVIEPPPIEMDITHFVLHQGTCAGCGKPLQAQLPTEHQAGYGPRLTALIGALAGMHRTPWRLVQDFCHSVLLFDDGGRTKAINRVAQAIVPHYDAIATVPGENSWAPLMKHMVPQHLAVAADLTTDRLALSDSPPSLKEAFA
jgi:hypothetical protein